MFCSPISCIRELRCTSDITRILKTLILICASIYPVRHNAIPTIRPRGYQTMDGNCSSKSAICSEDDRLQRDDRFGHAGQPLAALTESVLPKPYLRLHVSP